MHPRFPALRAIPCRHATIAVRLPSGHHAGASSPSRTVVTISHRMRGCLATAVRQPPPAAPLDSTRSIASCAPNTRASSSPTPLCISGRSRKTRSPARPTPHRRMPKRAGRIRAKKKPPRGAALGRNRRRPTLPGPCGPSTIGAVGLNCSVRNGKRCFPYAIATGKGRETSFPGPSKLHNQPTADTTKDQKIRQALDPLVPVSFTCCHASRSGLSTWWSSRGLTPSRGWESSS
jgi:hypothetical protein